MEFYLSQIIYWACSFAPRGWAFCHGALLPISANTALFSLLGTTFGGDGRTTMGLPDLRGRTPVGFGNGPGLADYRLGQKFGRETVTLNILEMPIHNHAASLSGGTVNVEMKVSSAQGDTHAPSAGSSIAASYDSTNLAEIESFNSSTPDTAIAGASGTLSGGNLAIGQTGGSQAHENRQPSLVLNPCIVLQGLFPSRN